MIKHIQRYSISVFMGVLLAITSFTGTEGLTEMMFDFCAVIIYVILLGFNNWEILNDFDKRVK